MPPGGASMNLLPENLVDAICRSKRRSLELRHWLASSPQKQCRDVIKLNVRVATVHVVGLALVLFPRDGDFDKSRPSVGGSDPGRSPLDERVGDNTIRAPCMAEHVGSEANQGGKRRTTPRKGILTRVTVAKHATTSNNNKPEKLQGNGTKLGASRVRPTRNQNGIRKREAKTDMSSRSRPQTQQRELAAFPR